MAKNESIIVSKVIDSYSSLHSVKKVARDLHISAGTVSAILKENNISLSWNAKSESKATGSPRRTKPSDDACFYCGGYSMATSLEGYCITLHCSAYAFDRQPCFHH